MSGENRGISPDAREFEPTQGAAIMFLVGHVVATLGMALIAIALAVDLDGLLTVANFMPFVGFLLIVSGLFIDPGPGLFKRYSWAFIWGEAGWSPVVRAANLPTSVVKLRWLAGILFLGSFLAMGLQIATKGFPES
jgi:hypothetical protein